MVRTHRGLAAVMQERLRCTDLPVRFRSMAGEAESAVRTIVRIGFKVVSCVYGQRFDALSTESKDRVGNLVQRDNLREGTCAGAIACYSNFPCGSHTSMCRRGGIGRRARLKIWYS